MPHFSIEYSGNIDADMTAFCREVSAVILATGLFETGAVRVRAIRCDAFSIADDLRGNAFADMSFRIGAGRSQDEKKRIGAAIFKSAQAFFAKQLSEPYFALSLEIREIDAELSWKSNTMHARLRHGRDHV